MPPRILLISHEFPPDLGGAGVVASDIADALNSFGCDVTVLTKKVDGRPKPASYDLIEVLFVSKIGFISYYNKLNTLKVHDFDKIIINDLGASVVACYFLKKEIKERCILWLHGAEPERIMSNRKMIFKLIGFRANYIKFISACKAIVSVSAYMKHKFIREVPVMNLCNKISVIENSINLEEFFVDKIDLHEKYGISKTKKILLSVGRIIRDKGYGDMYGCFKDLVGQGHDFHWILIGDGNYLDDLRRIARNDDLLRFMTFAGFVDRQYLRNFYSSVDVFWLLSQLDESFSLVYLEAMACGTTIIARSVGGCPELLGHGEYGHLVDSNSECSRLLKNIDRIKIDSDKIIKYAAKKSNNEFRKKIKDLITMD